MARVNPAQMVWARETAGLTREGAAEQLGIKTARGTPGAERLAAIEAEGNPTRTQLLDMVKVYRRPLLTFYMARPPIAAERGEDFRTIPRTQRDPETEGRLDALLRDVRARQLLIRNVLAEDDDAAPVSFIGSVSPKAGADAVLQAIRKSLSLPDEALEKAKTPDAVFATIRAAVERCGVFVLLIGDLGSFHSAIDPRAFRGFALADSLAPFIVVNDKDSRTAWSFTLIHELAHLAVGASGVSGGSLAGSPIEQLCNHVASQFLLPDAVLAKSGLDLGGMDASDALPLLFQFATERKLSPDMVAYRLLRAGRITRMEWNTLAASLEERLASLRAQEAERKKNAAQDESGAADYYKVRRHRLGGLVSFARQALAAGALTPTKAATVLGVKPRMVRTLVGAV